MQNKLSNSRFWFVAVAGFFVPTIVAVGSISVLQYHAFRYVTNRQEQARQYAIAAAEAGKSMSCTLKGKTVIFKEGQFPSTEEEDPRSRLTRAALDAGVCAPAGAQ